MSYLFIANLDQSKYVSLENGPTSQYSTKNNQYPTELISEAEITKNHRYNGYGMRKTDNKTPNHNKSRKNKSGQKEEKATEK